MVFSAVKSGDSTNVAEYVWGSTSTITISEFELPLISDPESKYYTEEDGQPVRQTSGMSSTRYYDVTKDNGGSDADDYDVVLEINHNFKWNEDQTGINTDGDLELTFTILKNPTNEIDITYTGETEWTFGESPDVSFNATSDFGEAKVYFYAEGSEVDDAVEWTSTQMPENAGKYYVFAKVEDTGNYHGGTSYGYYVDGVVTNTDNIVGLNIKKLPVDRPSLDEDENLVYSGKEMTLTSDMLRGWDPDIYVISERSDCGKEHKLDGEPLYNTYIGLKDNYTWKDTEDVNEDGTITISWNIDKRQIQLASDRLSRSILINSGVSNPSVSVCDVYQNPITDIAYTPIWSKYTVANVIYYGELTLSDDVFRNNCWIVDSANNGTSAEAQDSKLEDGKVLKIWYTFVLGTYDIKVDIDFITPQMYDGSPVGFPTINNDDISIADKTGLEEAEILEIESNFKNAIVYFLDENGMVIMEDGTPSSPINAGSYTIRVVVPATDNFGEAIWDSPGSLIISPMTISVDGLNDKEFTVEFNHSDVLESIIDKVGLGNILEADHSFVHWGFYDSEGNSLDESGIVDVVVDQNGDPVFQTVSFKLEAGDNYVDFEGSFSVKVTPKILEVTLTGEGLTSVFNGQEPEINPGYSANYPESDDHPVTFIIEPIDNSTTNAGTYDLIPHVDTHNYKAVLSGDYKTFEILKAPLADGTDSIPTSGAYVVFDTYGSGGAVEYNGIQSIYTNEGEYGIVDGETFTWTVYRGNETINTVKDVGTYNLTIVITSDSGNYSTLEIKRTILIEPRDIKFQLSEPFEFYYGETPVFPSPEDVGEHLTVSSDPGFSGFVSGETFADLGYSLTLYCDDDIQLDDDVTEYSVSLLTTKIEDENQNYNICFDTGTLIENKRPIVIYYADRGDDGSGITSSVYGLSRGEIEDIINSSETISTGSGAGLDDVFAGGQNPSDVFRLVLNLDNSIGAGTIVDVIEGGYEISLVTFNNNYDIDIVPDVIRHDVVADTLYAKIVTDDLGYDAQPQSVTIRYTDSVGEEISSPGVDVRTHLEYRFRLNASDRWSDWQTGDIVDAGYYDVRVVVDGTSNYVVQASDTSFTVPKADYVDSGIEIVYSGNHEQYDASWHALAFVSGTVTLIGGSTKDVQSVLSIRYYSDDGRTEEINQYEIVDARDYYAVVTLESPDTNYNDIVDMVTLTVDKCPVNVQWISSTWYNGETQTPESFVELDNESLEYEVEITSGDSSIQNAGNYGLRITLTDTEYNSNYTIENPTSTISVKQIPITIEAGNLTYSFGELILSDLNAMSPGFSLTVSGDYDGGLDADYIKGMVQSHVTYSLKYNPECSDVYVNVCNLNEIIEINYSGINFDVTPVEGDLIVNQAIITIEVPNQQFDYDPDGVYINPNGFTITDGEMYGQDVSISLRLETGTVIQHVGAYHIIATTTNPNFSIDVVPEDSEPSGDGVSAPYVTVVPADNDWVDEDVDISGWYYEQHDSVDDVILDWPEAINGTVHVQIVSNDQVILNFDEGNIPEDLLSLDAGTYDVVFTVNATADGGYTNYTDIDGTTENKPLTTVLVIDQCELNPSWSESSVVYDGEVHSVYLTGLEEYPEVDITVGDLDDEHPSYERDGRIWMDAVELGTYGIGLILDDPNYRWSESTGTTLRVEWTIGYEGENSWLEEPSIGSWQYGDPTPSYNPGEASFGSVTTRFYHADGENLGGLCNGDGSIPSEVGTYYMRSYVDEGNGEIGLEELVLFNITKRFLAIPELDVTEFGYRNGDVVRIDLESYDWFVELEEYVSYTGETGTEPGNYTLVLYINDSNNCVWDDGTSSGSSSPITIAWTISNTDELSVDMFSVDVDNEQYSGHPIIKNVTSSLVENEHYVVSYSNNVNASTEGNPAVITITGIGAYAGSVLTYEFNIEAAVADISFYNNKLNMYVEDESFINALRTPAYVSESGLQFVSSNPDVATVDPTSGAITMNSVGATTITVTVPGTNNYTGAQASYELTVSDHPVEVVDHVVYVKVPVTVPDDDDDDDQTDDRPETVYIERDNDLYIWLLIVMAVICVCFAAYILYTHRDQEGGA